MIRVRSRRKRRRRKDKPVIKIGDKVRKDVYHPYTGDYMGVYEGTVQKVTKKHVYVWYDKLGFGEILDKSRLRKD